ncbi:hypothetical protein WN59_06725 [Salinicoccus sediminis]|uniref:Uncharacterized protein n=1 Tax=Salinicoccus sediminis TaxID=1432562 RepID=A0A0M2SP72_9STAP|nr:hypothetical protein [Salinicoccus sediminis]KKK34717.1 hypothetical protein WN59_06725 [Salinicoccus sediminis]
MRAAGYALKYGYRNNKGWVYKEGCLEGTDLSETKAIDTNGMPFGGVRNGLLEVRTNDRGLLFILQLHEPLSYIPDLIENIRISNITGVGVRGNYYKSIEDEHTLVTKLSNISGIVISSMNENEGSNIRLFQDDEILFTEEIESLDNEIKEKEVLRMDIELCDL